MRPDTETDAQHRRHRRPRASGVLAWSGVAEDAKIRTRERFPPTRLPGLLAPVRQLTAAHADALASHPRPGPGHAETTRHGRG
jgi:hypothetical protein